MNLGWGPFGRHHLGGDLFPPTTLSEGGPPELTAICVRANPSDVFFRRSLTPVRGRDTRRLNLEAREARVSPREADGLLPDAHPEARRPGCRRPPF